MLTTCWCRACQHHEAELTLLECGLDRVVGAMLGRDGWGPRRIVREMARHAPADSLAVELVTIELICRAGHWLSRRDDADWLAEVDVLVAAIPDNGVVTSLDGSDFEMVMGGFHVGGTIPGWLGRHDAADGDMDLVRSGVLDAFAVVRRLDFGGIGDRRSG